MTTTARGMELEKLLNPLQKTVTSVTSNIARNIPSAAAQLNLEKVGSEIGSGMFSFAIALLIIFLILVVIHYMITPIFSFTGADNGSLALANTQDGQLKWSKGPVPSDLSANVQRIMDWGFTVQQDIYMENESRYSNKKRIFFYRAMEPVVATSSDDNLINDYPDSNLFMYLAPNTNNLIIAVVVNDATGNKYIETAPMILNVPVKQVLRITVVFIPQVLEVYMNGKLYATKTFRNAPIGSKAYFFGPPDAYRGTIRTMNFKYWDRPLTAGEVRKSTPPLPDAKQFNPSEMATAQCD
jgi:hypothetical protein